jgi:polysaccharide transporter, PST family
MTSPGRDGTDRAAPAPDGLKTDTLAASVVILLVLTVVQRMVGFLRGILFCRWLDAEQLGQWDLAFGFLMLAAPLAVLGLPGSFGRYVETYRQRGQLRPFLRRTGTCVALLTVLAVALVAAGRAWVSEALFGTTDNAGLVLLLAAGLGVVILDNTFVSLYTALRQIKFVSCTQFVNSMLFAGLGIGLVLFWKADAASVVLAYGGASCCTVAMSLAWSRRIWRALPATEAPLPNRALWANLLPFAFWLWMTNWLSNAFSLVDRFMIVHFSALPAAGAVELVGQYHTARIIPMLFVGVAELLAAMITPHLAADWEQGLRGAVSRRLCLILKLFSLTLVATSIAVLAFAPILFNRIWQERFAEGQAVLPLALVGSVWTGLAMISFNYVWYAEKSRFVCAALGVGLVLNVAMNVPLLLWLGLLGAVISTTAARLAVLGLVWWYSGRHGMRVDRGLVLAAMLPLVLCLGPWWALVPLAVVAVVEVATGGQYFTTGEREQMGASLERMRLALGETAARRWPGRSGRHDSAV